MHASPLHVPRVVSDLRNGAPHVHSHVRCMYASIKLYNNNANNTTNNTDIKTHYNNDNNNTNKQTNTIK